MSKRLKSAIAVFVFKQLDLILLCVSVIHVKRTICKDYVMICLSILFKISLEAPACYRITFISYLYIYPNNRATVSFICFHHTDTSRAKRDHETDGIDYHFLTKQKFEQDIMAGKFVEHGEFERSIYGTSLESIRTVGGNGQNLHLEFTPSGNKL